MRILIIKIGALGDIIFSTSIIRQISNMHQNDDVFLLTTPPYKKLFVGFNNINVVSFPRSGFINSIFTIKWIRKNKFDRIYDLQSNDRTSVYCALSGSPYRAGNHPRFPYNHHPDNKFEGECHAFDRLNQIIKSAGLPPAEPVPFLPAANNTQKEIAAWTKNNDLTKKNFAILHAGSNLKHLNKRWPYFADLAKQLKSKLKLVWVGGDDDTEINQQLSLNVGINATNQFDILALAELGRYARFAITNDSAPMHILSCSRIPIFGLFGPTYPRRTHALGQLNNVITPSNIIADNDKAFKPEPISNIKVETVLSRIAAQQLL